uniref:hypothetical protein n=1 Tax=Ancylomarina sp. TaxID=1970196 RepID=UPI00356A317A
LAMVSCDNEDMETAEMEEVVAIPEVLPTPEHLLGLKAELEAKGLELVALSGPTGTEAIETIEGEKITSPNIGENKTKSATNTPWSKMTKNDLENMWVDVNRPNQPNATAYKDRFAWRIGSGSQKPIAVYVNDVEVGDASGHNMTNDYGWYCERRVVVDSRQLLTDNGTIARKVPNTLIHCIGNQSGEVRTLEPTNLWSTSKTDEHSWWVAVTTGIAVKATVGLPFGIAGGEVEVHLDVEAGGGQSHSFTTDNNVYTPFVDIPVGYYAEFTCKETYLDRTYKYPCPMETKGYVGADYGPKRWNGHHFWALSSRRFFVEYSNNQLKYEAYLRAKDYHSIYATVSLYPLPIPGS